MAKVSAARRAGKILSKLGASKGGKARAAALSPARRRKIAKGAAEVRWSRMQSNRAYWRRRCLRFEKSWDESYEALEEALARERHVLNFLKRLIPAEVFLRLCKGENPLENHPRQQEIGEPT